MSIPMIPVRLWKVLISHTDDSLPQGEADEHVQGWIFHLSHKRTAVVSADEVGGLNVAVLEDDESFDIGPLHNNIASAQLLADWLMV